jgi:HSP20 family protein
MAMVNHFPFGQDFVVLRDAMNQLLEESFVPARGTRSGNGTSTVRPLPLDVYTTPDEAVVIAAVPGMNPQDLEVTVNQSVVTLSGTVPTAAESEQGKQATWYLHELWHGQFRRSVNLPFEVDASKADATFENGIVRIILPKAERARPHKIAIKGANQDAIEAGATDQGQND